MNLIELIKKNKSNRRDKYSLIDPLYDSISLFLEFRKKCKSALAVEVTRTSVGIKIAARQKKNKIYSKAERTHMLAEQFFPQQNANSFKL